MQPWMLQAAKKAETLFEKHGVKLTLGGEPTYVPLIPEGPEWNYSAVGPTKIVYARKMAALLQERAMPDSISIFSPGKLYPGEVNPRWAIRLLSRRDGKPLLGDFTSVAPASNLARITSLRREVCNRLKIPADNWVPLVDPTNPKAETWTLLLDHTKAGWQTAAWKIKPADRKISTAEGPAGLRLPLHLAPEGVVRRALTLQKLGPHIEIFLPPLLEKPFIELLRCLHESAPSKKDTIQLQGYLPIDLTHEWIVLGLTADPGVLEVNMPACDSWLEYAQWLEVLQECAEETGLCTWKQTSTKHQTGSGGGNHLLFGAPSIDENPFFTRPSWIASLLRYWQAHPSLSYLFTGTFVGPSSQAPRLDESGNALLDFEMALKYVESLPEGDQRVPLSESLRHLLTDNSGNPHRAEMSIDKFWNPASPTGCLGLVEFRAIETTPEPTWSSAIALLWVSLAAHLLKKPYRKPLESFGTELHGTYLLPTILWLDFLEVLNDLRGAGFDIEADPFSDVWNWRFPSVLEHGNKNGRLEVRRGLETWPLLSEMPNEGGMTSRFVDSSMRRLEIRLNRELMTKYHLHVNGRLVKPLPVLPDLFLAGISYRHSQLYPSLHPGIAPQTPIEIALIPKKSGKKLYFTMAWDAEEFTPTTAPLHTGKLPPARRRSDESLTYDLRF